MRFEMHCHTKEGSPDGKVSLADYIQILKKKGYDGMLITDHNSYKGYDSYRVARSVYNPPVSRKNITKSTSDTDDFVVLKGIEYDTSDAGHIIVIMPEYVCLPILEYRGLPAKRLIQIVHAHGGILGPAHPCAERFLSFCTSPLYKKNPRIIKQFDFLEIFNSCEPPRDNNKAIRLAKLTGICGISGSDSHNIDGVGLSYTDFPGKIRAESDLIRIIKEFNRTKTDAGKMHNPQKILCHGEYYHGTLKEKLGIFNNLLVYGFYPYNKLAAFLRLPQRYIQLHKQRKKQPVIPDMK